MQKGCSDLSALIRAEGKSKYTRTRALAVSMCSCLPGPVSAMSGLPEDGHRLAVAIPAVRGVLHHTPASRGADLGEAARQPRGWYAKCEMRDNAVSIEIFVVTAGTAVLQQGPSARGEQESWQPTA